MEERQDLDLIEVLRWLGNGIKNLIKGIAGVLGSLLKLTYQYRQLFAVMIIATLGAGYFLSSGNRRVYRGDFTAKLNAGDANLIAAEMSTLNGFVKARDYQGLSEALRLKSADAEQIAFIKTYYFVNINRDSSNCPADYSQKYAADDTTNLRCMDQIVISVGLKDRRLFGEMQQVIVDHFNSNPYLQSKKDLHKKIIETTAHNIDQDLSRLDSLQNIEFFDKKDKDLYLTDKTTIRSGKQDLYYGDKLELMHRKQQMEKELSEADNVMNVITPFTPAGKPTNTFLKTTAPLLGAAYLLFLLIALLHKRRKT